MKMHKVLNRENQRVITDIDARQTKLEITTKTLDQTRPNNQQHVFNEDQYLAMIETLGFLNEKAEKEILNLNKITKVSREEAARMENKARALKSHMVVPNLLLTEYKEDVKTVTSRYEMGISKMKQLITSKKSSLTIITSKVTEIKDINKELMARIHAIDKASLDINIFANKRISDDAKKQIYINFDQLLLNEKQKNAILNSKLESLEVEQATLKNKLIFLEDELGKQTTQINLDNTQKFNNSTSKKRVVDELYSLNARISKQNEEIQNLTSEINKNKEFIENFLSNKTKLENQINNLIKDINEIQTRPPSTAEVKIKSQIEAYKTKLLEVRSNIASSGIEINSLQSYIDDLNNDSQLRTVDIKSYMDDIAKLESDKTSNIEQIEKIREEIRRIKRDLNVSDPIYTEICEVIDNNKKYDIELIEKYNQNKEQFRIEFQTSKVCIGDKLNSSDLQIATLRKLINEQLLKRKEKEAILEKITKKTDFDWQKLTNIVNIKSSISKTKTAILNIKSEDVQSSTDTLKNTIKDLESKKLPLQEQVADLKRNLVTFESEYRVTYDVKIDNYETKLNNLRDLIQKRKESIAKLEIIFGSISNNSVLVTPEKTTLENQFEKNYKRKIDLQSREIEDLKNVLNEYSSNL